MKIVKKYLVAVGLIMCLCHSAYAQEITVSGQGTSRDGAIADALRAAVEQAVGVLVDAQTVTRNYQVINDDIYTKAQGFVEDYRVINEKPGDVYTVTLRANISTTPSSEIFSRLQRLHLIETMLNNPRIAVLIPESFQQHPLSTSACETAVIQKLRENGFTYLLDPQQLSAIRKKQILESILEGNIQQTKALVREDQLDYIVVGQAVSQYAGDLYDSGVKSSRAHIDAKIVKVDTGEIIAVKTMDSSGVDITPQSAAEKALTNAGGELANALIPDLMQYAANPDKPVSLLFHQASFQKIRAVQDLLKDVPGVRSVKLRSYSQGLAEITLTYPGTTKTLMESIDRIAQFPIMVTNLTNSAVECNL